MKKFIFILLAVISLPAFSQRPDTLNYGTGPDTDDGDELRDAFIKVYNDNEFFDSVQQAHRDTFGIIRPEVNTNTNTLGGHLIDFTNPHLVSVDELVNPLDNVGISLSNYIFSVTGNNGGQISLTPATPQIYLVTGDLAGANPGAIVSIANGDVEITAGNNLTTDYGKITLGVNTVLLNSVVGGISGSVQFQANGFFYGGDYSATASGTWLTTKDYVDDLFGTALEDSVVFNECSADTTTNFIIGDIGDYSFLIHYVAHRDVSGEQYQSGTIHIAFNPTNGDVSYSTDYVGPNIGFTLQADLNSNDLRLNAVVDNTNSNSVFFDWKFYSKLY